jgi:hypothetical protein
MNDITEAAGTAVLVRRLKDFHGDARLYRVSPPMEGVHEYVVVSAVDAPFTGPETFIFPGDADGDVTEWGELDGSFRGALDHEAALSGAGYEMADGPNQ